MDHPQRFTAGRVVRGGAARVRVGARAVAVGLVAAARAAGRGGAVGAAGLGLVTAGLWVAFGHPVGLVAAGVALLIMEARHDDPSE